MKFFEIVACIYCAAPKIATNFLYQYLMIRHPVSCIQYPASCIQYPVSPIPLLRQRYPYLHSRPRIGCWRTGRNIRDHFTAVVIQFYIYPVVEEIIYGWADSDLFTASCCKIIILVKPAIGSYIIPDFVINAEIDLIFQFFGAAVF